PSLDESVFKLWGALPGLDGRIIEKALQHPHGSVTGIEERRTEIPHGPQEASMPSSWDASGMASSSRVRAPAGCGLRFFLDSRVEEDSP
ncbi:MAG TPA: hypothetical protein VLL94_07680, partial [Nitrospiraceae bacterium]|nr:hypothetical protein [Nitrospiraceae bacterium]